MATTKTVNYTSEQEARFAELATELGGSLNSAACETLASEMGKTLRSVVAKASRLGIYRKKEYISKSGEAVQKKDGYAEAIGAVLKMSEGEIDSLTKANKTALEKIFKALANSKPI